MRSICCCGWRFGSPRVRFGLFVSASLGMKRKPSKVDQLVFEELVHEKSLKLGAVNHLDYLGVQVAWVIVKHFPRIQFTRVIVMWNGKK
ncbi:hypothetical protein MRB53_023219 [Persea americana]|uniref:Uncharacterized protein n=1 Tax=Persea americana TaxID=3435 RepID=A0ACC2L8Y3_PERAE|nr:hypothetical protein MRB53_023219 [Persea americana]